jgi:hypothetical protein
LKKFNLFNRKSIIGGASLKQSMQSFSDWLRIHHKQCIICDRIDYSLNRYAYTLMHLWEHDKEFQDSFSKSKGLCFSHLPVVLDMAAECLNSTKLAKFLQTLLPLQMENMDRLEKELLWFTQKFDYRNQDKPWGSSKDALPRILQKLTGKYM